jgi:hypothetical protein
MKSLINTRMIAIALVATFAVAFTTPALADNGKNTNPVELKYLGEYKSQPVFELTFNTEDNNDYVVIIRDDARNIVHKEVVKGGTVSRKYMITNELADVNVLEFEVTARKTDKTAVFQVNKNSRVVEDLVVNKIK